MKAGREGLLGRTGLWAGVIAFAVAGMAGIGHAQDAKTQFQTYCARCHGDTGKGDGPDGVSLSPKPANFRDCTKMSKVSQDTIVKAIKDGGAAVGLSSDMPAWGEGLDDDTIKALASYIRAYCK